MTFALPRRRLPRGLRLGAGAVLVALLAAGCGDTGTGEGGGDPAEDASLDDVEVTIAPLANLEYPTAMAARPGSDLLYVAEQAGRVRVLAPGPDGALALFPQPVLDISAEVGPDEPGGEPGLLGITFSPDGSRLYLSYTHTLAPVRGWRRRITEWTMDGDQVVAASRRPILDFRKNNPQHNGGDIRFGPDGYLYAGFGDTAPVADAFNTGQDPSDLIGGIIRIDPLQPDPGVAYGIPDDNPWSVGTHQGVTGAPEVWLYGTRNPWRISFDRETGDLWVADVGDQRREEITRLPAADGGGSGANLGWSNMEGTANYRGRDEPENHTPPAYDYPHSTGGCSVIGGYVYRGEAIPDLVGTYVFSDYCLPTINGLRVGQDGEPVVGELGPTAPDSALAFGEDLQGELYVLTATGVYAILPASAGGPGATATTGAAAGGANTTVEGAPSVAPGLPGGDTPPASP